MLPQLGMKVEEIKRIKRIYKDKKMKSSRLQHNAPAFLFVASGVRAL
jgi:hypothetical protein